MSTTRSRLAAIIFSSCMLVPAFAFAAQAQVQAGQGMTAAQTAFDSGRFAEAASLARSLETADGLALAARAGLAQGDFITRPAPLRKALFRQAETDARAAIALAPGKVEGHLYLALALGFLGRMDGALAAHFAGYAEEARLHIDHALALSPDDPWANALMGGWNLEIAHDGGLVGEAMYGASVERGMAAYRRALSLDPGNAAIAYQYALQLIVSGGSAAREEARHVLAVSLRHGSSDTFDALARHRALDLELALNRHDEAALRAILVEQLGSGANSAPRSDQALRPLGVRAIGSPR